MWLAKDGQGGIKIEGSSSREQAFTAMLPQAPAKKRKSKFAHQLWETLIQPRLSNQSKAAFCATQEALNQSRKRLLVCFGSWCKQEISEMALAIW